MVDWSQDHGPLLRTPPLGNAHRAVRFEESDKPPQNAVKLACTIARDPAKFLSGTGLNVADSPPERTLVVLRNFHHFFKNPLVISATEAAISAAQAHGGHVIILSPVVDLPAELRTRFIVVDHDLPSPTELHEILKGIDDQLDQVSEDDVARVIKAASGLTREQAGQAFGLSLVEKGHPDPEIIWDLKAQSLEKTGQLKLYRGQDGFAQLGGLEQIKKFCRYALREEGPDAAQPRGVLLLGVPGTGKSAFAKALGNETHRPTVLFDIGAMKGSLVGQSETNLRRALAQADAMSPCVLFIDEIEKALAGSQGSGANDSGVMRGMFGTLLTWLNDHESDVFVVATCNDIGSLPPEFSRAERWDAVFFMDLPSEDEKEAIWKIYGDLYSMEDQDPNFNPHHVTIDDTDWTGAEIRACCRLSSLLNTTLEEAASFIVPVAITARETVESLRDWAKNRAVSASYPGRYSGPPVEVAPVVGAGERSISRSQ
jgi:hypothetical protein